MNTLALRRPRWDKEYTAVLLTVAIPVALQNLISIGLNLVDVLMIGKLGVEEVAAVGAANRLYSLFGMMCFGLISGFSVYVAQYWGVRDVKNIRRVYGLALTATGLMSLLFVLLAFTAGLPFMHLFIKEAHVLDLGQRYLRIAVFSYPLIALSFSTSFSSRAFRRVKVTTAINALALGTNTLLNYCLIFGNWGFPRLGVEGAAIATVIARTLELALLFWYVYGSREHPLAGRPRELFSFNRAFTRKVLRTTLPVLANEGSITLGVTFFYVAVGLLGTAAVAVMQVSMVVNDFFLAIFYGVGNAVSVITGNELGRGQKSRAYDNGKMALWFTVALSLLMSMLMLLARGGIVRLYNFDPVTSAMLSEVLLVRSFFTLPRMLVYVLIIGLLRAGGDTRFCMIVDAGCVCLIGVPLAFFGALVLGWQLPGVLALLFCCDLFSCLLCLRRFKSKVWINTLI